jgi:DTW domain-containing protein YfiP
MIEPFRAHTNILLLQHPNEFRKYYSTAKLVRASITNCRLMRGVMFDDVELQHALASYKPFLLYPGHDAHDCEALPLTSNNIVIVIDGTWDEAQKIVYRNPLLHSIPRVSFQRPLTSSYRIRRPPKSTYLSTVESIGHLLTLNAVCSGCPQMIPNYQGLFHVFNEMIERQLACLGSAGTERK